MAAGSSDPWRLGRPQAVMMPRPLLADVAMQDGMETVGHDRDTHVDVDDDAADRRQHCEIAHGLELTRDGRREPEREARDEQRRAADHHQPEELLLPEVEPSGG